MSAHSKIEWTDHTFNAWIGCTKVSPGCANCYAESEDKRRGWTPEGWGKGKPRKRTTAAYWKQAEKWEAEAEREGIRFKVFCASLADVFDPEVSDEWRHDLFDLIVQTPHLDWQLLTKRPEIARDFCRKWIGGYPNDPRGDFLHNVWLGVSVEDQQRADERIPILLQIPAAVRFLSCEPLLGPVEIAKWLTPDECGCGGHDPAFKNCIDWVIVGGESGPKARPCNVEWIRDIVTLCQVTGVRVFVKQLGSNPHGKCCLDGQCQSPGWKCVDRKGGDIAEWPEELRVREFPSAQPLNNSTPQPAP
jgi:protein gp37